MVAQGKASAKLMARVVGTCAGAIAWRELVEYESGIHPWEVTIPYV
jgi:hypothetical protein